MRQQRAPPILAGLKEWLEEQQPQHLPQSPIGKAITYTLNNWAALNHFLSDARIELDNNRSERALRVIALGCKNYLFAGHDEAAQNLAILYSLVATCELHGANPDRYLADMLIRVQSHPNSQIAELMPQRWVDWYPKLQPTGQGVVC